MNINIGELLPLIDRLKNEKYPIVLYGMGNGADKILDLCNAHGIIVSGVFASDGFVRNKMFRGMPVRSYAETKAELGEKLIVLLSFATSRPEVLENVYRISSENTLLAPDVPAFGDTVFSLDFFRENESKFDEVYSLFSDERSKELYIDIIKYKLTGEIKYLEKADEESDYVHNIIYSSKIFHFVDAGAYKGDTALRQLEYSPGLKSIIAIEPDPRTYAKLCAQFEHNSKIEFIGRNYGLWNESATLPFLGDGGRGGSAAVGRGKKTAEFRTLDSIVGDRKVDYIKYDVEGVEYEALIGSAETIKRNRPKMLISLYHRSEDLFRLPLLAKVLMPESKMFLRRLAGIPAWDINLLLVPEEYTIDQHIY